MLTLSARSTTLKEEVLNPTKLLKILKFSSRKFYFSKALCSFIETLIKNQCAPDRKGQNVQLHTHSSSKRTTQELRKLQKNKHRAHLQPLDHWQTWHDLVVVALNNYCTLVSCVINLGCQKEEGHMLFRPIQLREKMLESRPEDALVKLFRLWRRLWRL